MGNRCPMAQRQEMKHVWISEPEVLAQWSICLFWHTCDKHKCRFSQSTILWSNLSTSWTGKERKYNDRVMNIEQGSFTPLVYFTSGGLGNECQTFYRHLANKIATKANDKVLTWIRCRLSFMVVKAALLCFIKRQSYCKQRGNRYCWGFHSCMFWSWYLKFFLNCFTFSLFFF